MGLGGRAVAVVAAVAIMAAVGVARLEFSRCGRGAIGVRSICGDGIRRVACGRDVPAHVQRQFPNIS